MTSTLTELIPLSLDLLEPMWVEVCMFALAGLCYSVCSGTATGIAPCKSARASKEPPFPIPCSTKSPAPTPAPPASRSHARSKGARGGKVQASHGICDLQKHTKAITNFGKEGRLDKAVALFDSVREEGWSVSASLYNSLLDACIQCGDLAAAKSYFSDMESLGLQDTVSFNTMMRGYITGGDTGEAHGLLQEMTARGIVANHSSYHCLLLAAAQRQDHRGMWQFLKDMQSAQLRPNAVTYSILLKAIIAGGSASPREDLLRVAKLMDAPDLQVDEVLFTALAEACVRTGSIELLSGWVQRWSILGRLSKLTPATYGSIIKAYGQARDVERVWEFWRHMEDRKVQPTAITLGCMVEALVVNGCSEEAWELVQKLLRDDELKSSVNTVTYSTILKGFAMAKRHDRVTALHEEMKAQDIPRNLITYNTVLNSIARCGLMHKAPEVLEDMRTADPPVEPDIVTYSTLVKGYCLSGDLDRGLQMLKDMRSGTSLAPDEVMYNSLLDGCARQQRLDDALRLLDEMQEAGIAPSNFTMSIVVKLLSRARRLGQAFEMVEAMGKKYGFRPNIQVYTCLISSCFHNRQLRKALSLHDQLVGEGILPDCKTYTALAWGCLKAGACEKAVQVVRCSYHLPCQGLSIPPGKQGPAGVEAACLQEVLSSLGHSCGAAAARALEEDIEKARRRRGTTGASGRRPQSR